MFVYKHTETIALKMRNFQGIIVFIFSQAYSENFKSALVYL